jgi:O-antigen ligase
VRASGTAKLWTGLAALLVVGYLSVTRSFAYLGVPSLNLFVGEVALAAFLLSRPEAVIGRWAGGLLGRSAFGWIAWALLLFVGYGLLELARGIYAGYPLITTLKTLAFTYYPLYLFLGIWLGMRDAGFLPRVLRLLAWANGLYGVAYLAGLNRLEVTIPGSEVPLFGQPAGSAVAVLGLLAFEPRLGRIWLLLLLNGAVLLGGQVRAEWLGFAAGLVTWTLLSRRLRRAVPAAAAVALLLAVAAAADVRFPSPRQRGGEIAVRELAARVIAPIHTQAAGRLSERAAIYAGTFSWRTEWWKAIWTSINEEGSTGTFVFGHGYGFPLHSLVYHVTEDVRTPHNVFLYALGYGGWLGVAAFVALQASLACGLWRAYRHTGQPFGLAFFALALSGAHFGNFFETPYGAIPFFLLVGLALAFAVRPLPLPARAASGIRAPVTRAGVP